MMKQPRLAYTVIALSALLGITACSDTQQRGSDPYFTEDVNGNFRILRNISDAGMEALYTGTLTSLENGCFVLTDPQAPDQEVVPLAFPKDALLQPDGTIIVGDATLQVGDELLVGGGLWQGEINLSTPCNTDGVWVISSIEEE